MAESRKQIWRRLATVEAKPRDGRPAHALTSVDLSPSEKSRGAKATD